MKTIISADTQYNDLVGNIAIDKIFNKDIEEFFKDKGIDTDKYTIVSFSFILNGNSTSMNVNTTHLKHKEILKCKKQSNSIPIKVFYFDMSIEELLKYIKRLSFTVTSHKEIQDITMTIEEEVAL